MSREEFSSGPTASGSSGLSSGLDRNESQQRPAPEDSSETSVLPRTTITPRPNYVPPLNFSFVEDGIYRSGFPMPINYPFMKQLKLKTIIYVGDLCCEKPKKDKPKKDKEDKPKKDKEDKPKKDKNGSTEIYDKYKAWIDSTDIKFCPLVVHSSQEPFTSVGTQAQTQESLEAALNLILDKRNFPILIHSNKGKHRIGVLVGLMRKILQGWCMSGIFEEYEKFAMGKSEFDLEFIEMWQPELSYEEEWLPGFVRH